MASPYLTGCQRRGSPENYLWIPFPRTSDISQSNSETMKPQSTKNPKQDTVALGLRERHATICPTAVTAWSRASTLRPFPICCVAAGSSLVTFSLCELHIEREDGDSTDNMHAALVHPRSDRFRSSMRRTSSKNILSKAIDEMLCDHPSDPVAMMVQRQARESASHLLLLSSHISGWGFPVSTPCQTLHQPLRARLVVIRERVPGLGLRHRPRRRAGRPSALRVDGAQVTEGPQYPFSVCTACFSSQRSSSRSTPRYQAGLGATTPLFVLQLPPQPMPRCRGCNRRTFLVPGVSSKQGPGRAARPPSTTTTPPPLVHERDSQGVYDSASPVRAWSRARLTPSPCSRARCLLSPFAGCRSRSADRLDLAGASAFPEWAG
ncbi:hypothetical protein VFPBJ_01069 [Purpureocillium lilacinum]|uniref:Uncharacterized protein n=1 Tax=Purpureocillium lilacinum TaxID=33203 RepID=A0A179HC39_PURLI|nr:hypothetical protein VFPBJ_01069 [Purpureocillium lilacinum]